jgi:hypothetical protein
MHTQQNHNVRHTVADQKTRLFTINLWQVQQGDDPLKRAWRGKLQSLPDGEAYYFRDWTVLIQHLELMLGSEQEKLKNKD